MGSFDTDDTMDLQGLPVVVLENIFSYLNYDEIARFRIVSKAFNVISKRLLNRGFLMIERRHAAALKAVKVQLPRRESERRYHPLARHSDILTSLETRISMLNMTYTKFIDHGICCFIPGKVIDEMHRVLTVVETSQTPPRAHEVLQELRDISSMAIEHFDDKISPAFRKKLQEGAVAPPQRPTHAMLAPIAVQELFLIRRRLVLNTKLSYFVTAQHKRFYKRMVNYKRIIRALARKQKEQDSTIAELKKRIEEVDIKYTELTHTNQAAGGKAIAGSSADVQHFGSQIKLDLSVLPIGTNKRSQNKDSNIGEEFRNRKGYFSINVQGVCDAHLRFMNVVARWPGSTHDATIFNNSILRDLPNIKPRKPLIKLPSLSEDDAEPPNKISKMDDTQAPSTSTPKTTLDTIRGIADEIRTLSKMNIEGKLKRPLNLNALEILEVEMKKQKMD